MSPHVDEPPPDAFPERIGVIMSESLPVQFRVPDRKLRVPEREFRLNGRKFRKRIARGMHGVGRAADILDQIVSRSHGEGVVFEVGITPLRVPRVEARFAAVHLVENFPPAFPLDRVRKAVGERPRLYEIRVVRHIRRIVPPCPPPGGPAPDMRVARKIVTVAELRAAQQAVDSADVHDAFVVAVTLQEFPAVPEKGRVRQAVVFEDDSLFHFGKEPADRRTHGVAAAEILFPEEGCDFAFPIDLRNDSADLRNQGGLFRPFRTGTVAGDEKTAGGGSPDGFENTPRTGGAVEYREKDRRLRRSAFHIPFDIG